MKPKLTILCLLLTYTLGACQTVATPFPTITTMSNEITLAPGQTAVVSGTNLTITFHSVVGDERCPSGIECAASGPVTVSLAVQQGEETPTDFTLQTFTDQEGRSPNVQFEGITNRAEVAGYVIQIVSVTPYPQSLAEIESTEYRLGLLVSSK